MALIITYFTHSSKMMVLNRRMEFLLKAAEGGRSGSSLVAKLHINSRTRDSMPRPMPSEQMYKEPCRIYEFFTCAIFN